MRDPMTEKVHDLQKEIPVMEMFDSIQGEGANQGKPAFFIRLAGCDIGCVWCDVKDSWNVNDHSVISYQEIFDQVMKVSSPNIVITGGEPLLYNLDPLCKILKKSGKTLWLETSGAYPLSGTFDWVCVSPKKFKAPLPELLNKADELKVVVYHPSDIEWAEEHAKKVRSDCRLFLQPEWDRSEIVMPVIDAYIIDHPQWNISKQIHKLLGVR